MYIITVFTNNSLRYRYYPIHYYRKYTTNKQTKIQNLVILQNLIKKKQILNVYLDSKTADRIKSDAQLLDGSFNVNCLKPISYI